MYDRFERSITNSAGYTDPIRDVTLDVTYTRPGGDTIAFWGFHDGGTTWKIRFMPDRIGTWSYVATFSDGSPGVSGTFECVPSSIPGRLARDPANPIWFGYSSGEHELVRSFHVGDRLFARNWNGRKTFLDWARSQGYNMLSIASHYLNREVAGRGGGWDTPDLWPIEPAEYRYLEGMLDDLADRRMLVYPFAGHFGQSSDFPTGSADQELYVRYTLARIGAYWNVVLNVAGPEPLAHPTKFQNGNMTKDDIRRLGRLLASLDPYDTPLSVHNGVGNDPFRNDDWTTYVTLQGWKDKNWSGIHSGMMSNHTGDKPVYAQEVFWPGNKYHGDFDADQIRKKGFVLLLAATTINFADMDGNSSSGFSGDMDLSTRQQYKHDAMKRVWDLFDTFPFHTMEPHQGLVTNGFCLADPGTEYVVYLVSGGTTDVTVTGGTFGVEWINPRNPSDVRDGGTTRDGQDLTAPDGQDWLLRLRVVALQDPPQAPSNLRLN